MAEKALSRQEALDILARHPEARKKKAFEDLTIRELRSKANEAREAEAEQREYSNLRARRHAGPIKGKAQPVTHIDPKNPPAKHPGWKYQQDQFVVGHGPQEKVKADKAAGIKAKPEVKAKPPKPVDVLRAVDKKDQQNRKDAGLSKKQFTPEPEITFYVYGLYKKSGLREPITLSKRVNHPRLAQAYTYYSGNINDMMNYIFEYDVPVTEEQGEGWLQVYSVSVVTGQYVPVEEEA